MTHTLTDGGRVADLEAKLAATKQRLVAAQSGRAQAQKASRRLREQVGGLRMDLRRAKGTQPGTALSDFDIAAILLDELRARLISSAASNTGSSRSALRAAAREVAYTRQQLADRSHNDQQARA